ncbi:helicase with zinc finger domain 2 [Sceloporus undulatus]|uniref:helicase with zinc finger domain 2 n=1 Tax=Sceloporus undulatus TaxID=8520 RepID=UPI001C4D57B8|nr:helicase with zinc finger domain 2 [Sceloporus undulatus]XP_042318317.1 helicase with zinc finger domain 2 [Sceloporus undulatus]XP_042318318.1 helicase with zinc finger domain 2 [Sceloporus undulatus]XP_042318319.1 helicase with zinc finger domain 2 [Sceloporus undulatus]
MHHRNGVVQTPLDGLREQLFLYLACSKCSLQENEITYRLKEVEHHCMMEILLARCKGEPTKLWRKVGRRPNFPSPAHYDICRHYVPGLGCTKHRNLCTFAWSQEEVIVWTFERKNNMERHILKMLLQRAQSSSLSSSLTKPPSPSISEKIRSEFGGHFQEICKTCFYQTPQRISTKDSGRTCEKHWEAVLVHVVTNGKMKEQYTEIRPRPGAMKKFIYCEYISTGRPCNRTLRQCYCAHSDVELAVWEAEQSHGLARIDLLYTPVDCKPVEEDSRPKVRFYCRVCLVTCDSQECFENHCSSLEHAQLITTDSMVEWTHRAPPYNPKGFVLCSQVDGCEYGENCAKAHSIEELEEWIQRAKVAETNKMSAKQDGLLSYQDRLVAEYQESHNEVLILSEEVDGVIVTCQQPLRVQSEDKKMCYRWLFTVHSQKPLVHVALLRRVPGATFSLAADGHNLGLTYASGKRFKTRPGAAVEVGVFMECHTFGVYEQWLVFDVGSRPVLVRKLQAKVGQKETSSWRMELTTEHSSHFVDFERWHSGNRVVVPGVERTADELELLAKYKAPSLALDFQRDAQGQPITPLNYREQMHNFLFREEEAQRALIAKLSLQVVLSFRQMMAIPLMGMKCAPQGELYAEITTPYSLTQDSEEGRLLHRSVNTAFLAPAPPTNNRVFEVSVERSNITDRSIWLLLPRRCCFELGLKADMSLQVEVQFQINQLLFRKWHHAVDKLCDVRLVLPDVATCSIPQPLRQGLLPLLHRGNAKQNQALSFIIGQVAGGIRQVPPLLIYGPFGTGKTFTLAMATLEIIKQPGTRVLICTHTNSAADIYIREYFHDYVTSGHPEAIPLQIKYIGHCVKTTDPITLRYCCLSPNRDSFRLPTKKELDQYRIIITTCMLSLELGLTAGYFSHILIDEAAQMLECEALVPLSLATLETRIILAGDHMQVTPKLSCLREGEQWADHTLLNRLFRYYKKEKHEVALRSRIIFNENYRSTPSIIDFVSRHFYVGKGDAICAKGNVPPHPEFYPLMFCHVAGSPERDMSMTSWLNNLEIREIIEKLEEIKQRWPDEWGERDLKRICVVSHGMQVKALRQELRKKSLGDVTVESDENLPGKTFRVIIISTVHSRESLSVISSSNLDFFNDSRVLNTIMTRAQSQVIVVGDAVALCSYGRCSKVWKGFIRECIDHRTMAPETLTLEEIRQAVCDQATWNRESLKSEEDGSDTDSWFSEAESLNIDDPILQELLDESNNFVVTVSDEGLMNVRSEEPDLKGSRQEYTSYSPQTMMEYLRKCPNIYKRCEFMKESFDRASAFSLDDSPALNIQIKGRVNCGMAFSGDQVLVEILQNKATSEGSLHGKVVGVMKAADRNRIFICSVDDYDLRVMIPIDRSVTKIFVPGLKDERNIIPIRRVDQEGKIKLKSRKTITQEDKKKCLFVVQVIKWREGFYFPLGIVMQVLPVASTLEEGLQILDIECSLPQKYPDAVFKEVAKFTSNKTTSVKDNRKDCRTYRTFTVDPPGARDLDDAISIRDLGDKYEIGIHIADMASVIPKGSALDTEAKNRGTSYYAPGKEPVSMFPPELSQDLCSLLPQKERHVISLFVLVDKKNDQMTKLSFTLSTIRSDLQLTYDEAEDIIKTYYRTEAPSLHFDTLKDCIAVAYHFSQVHRKARLHEDCYYEQLDEDCPLGQRCSHQMVQELMILFNSSVGEFLTSQDSTRSLIPLRCQMEPNPQQMTQMRNKFRGIIPLSNHLSHHLGGPTTEVHMETSNNFVLLASTWEHLKSAASVGDIPKMLDLIVTDDIHPKLAPVNLEFRKLLSRSYFLRSNSSVQSKVGHYSLHVDSYTWATSPIRRYIDVVLQRHILSLILKEPVQYSPEDIEFLCYDFNRKNAMAAAYEKKAHSLEMAAQLKCQVQQKVAFVMNVEEMAKNFKVLFPFNKETLPDLQLINYRALQLVAQPFFIEERGSIKLAWRRRVYSMVTLQKHILTSSLLQDKRVTVFNAAVWCDVLAAVRNQEYYKVLFLLEKGHIKQLRHTGRIKRSKCLHYVELSVELGGGDVLDLQLTTDVQRGFLVPFVQLWTITPGFDVCLEHSEKPIECFSQFATQSSKEKYKDAFEYRKIWLPLSDMEAASCAVAENDSIVLQDVKIIWEKKRTKKGQLQGTISFTKEFLKECAIEVDFSYCYLCIRLSDLKPNGIQNSVEILSHNFQQLSLTKQNCKDGKLLVDPATYTWVAHGCTEEFESNDKSDQRGEAMVRFSIHFMSMENIPVEVTQESSRFTVELIPKLLPDVRKEKAIWQLEHATQLAKGIALGHWIPKKPVKSSLLERRSFDLPESSRRLNPSQNQAVLQALTNPYTLIQGPPGTGKTVVGAHIVYWFHRLNLEHQEKEPTLDDTDKAKTHILYCGPSNKSVDVVAEMLMKMKGSQLRPLRVYGEMVESMEFPYPGSSLHISRKAQRESKSKPEIRRITLHYLMRERSNPYSSKICVFDARVKRGEEITEEEVEKYKRLLGKARKYELERHDVILCTCSAASSGSLKDSLNVRQVLVDECAMSTEPETLIPLVNYKTIEKVVLLGDHQQLRPVVYNDFCRALGMETSLFERYKGKALMLDIQYRMHRDICAFPSEAFYDNKLKTCPQLIRRTSTLFHRGRPSCAIIFGHIEGKENSLMVTTEEGNENSKANFQEAEQVVRIAKQLTLDRTTKPEEIAILTPYNAQVVEIKKRLSLVGLQTVTVCTIMKSQGSEWKYVIVSTVRSCAQSEIDKKPTKSWLKKYLGFVSDQNQINVAITRAQEGLCIIGNRYLLESNSLWRRLVEHYRKQGCYTTAAAIQIRQRSAAR